MVEKISKVSSTASSAATRIDHSVSIAEPDIAWVAERQSAINANLFSPASKHMPHDEHRASGGDAGHLEERDIASREDDGEHTAERLSGESERIGAGNLDDDDVPFGSHSGFI